MCRTVIVPLGSNVSVMDRVWPHALNHFRPVLRMNIVASKAIFLYFTVLLLFVLFVAFFMLVFQIVCHMKIAPISLDASKVYATDSAMATL